MAFASCLGVKKLGIGCISRSCLTCALTVLDDASRGQPSPERRETYMNTGRTVILRKRLQNFQKQRTTNDFLLSGIDRSSAGL